MNRRYALVAARAAYVCEYCRAPEAVFNLPFEVEHIKPLARGGDHSENNLALACRSCNLYKSDAVSGFDPDAEDEIRLFHPRIDVWAEHFVINQTTGEIRGLSSIGRATTRQLRINSRAQTAARRQWLKLGFFR